MATLFQNWLAKARRGRTATELMYFNPVKAKIGTLCSVDVAGYTDVSFKVAQIRVYTRTIRGKEFSFTDYDLQGTYPGTENKKIRLRYLPQSQKTPQGYDFRILFLAMDEDHEYNADEHNALKNDTGEFEIFGPDEQLESRWFRIDDVRGAYHPLVVNIKDENGDGTVKDSEVTQQKLEYWDFNRQVKADGNDVVEYYFVEIAEDTGWIQTFRGTEIEPYQLTWI